MSDLQVVETVEVVPNEAGGEAVLLNGEEFPYHVLEDGLEYEPGYGEHFGTLTLRLPVDDFDLFTVPMTAVSEEVFVSSASLEEHTTEEDVEEGLRTMLEECYELVPGSDLVIEWFESVEDSGWYVVVTGTAFDRAAALAEAEAEVIPFPTSSRNTGTALMALVLSGCAALLALAVTVGVCLYVR